MNRAKAKYRACPRAFLVWASLLPALAPQLASAQDAPAEDAPAARPALRSLPRGATGQLKGAITSPAGQIKPVQATKPVAAAPDAPAPAPDATPAGKAAPAASAAKKAGDTSNLPQFEQAMEYEPRKMSEKVSFSLEDADLSELVRVIGQLTGKRFIFGGKVKSVKASVYSPQKVTVAEAYQAFLSILEQNGLTVVPHGRFLKIIETPGAAAQGTPTYGPGQGVPNEERYVTRMHRLKSVSADDAANVLGKFKSKDGDIVAYAPGNMLIITDTGSNIRRMIGLLEQIDVGSSGDQVWIEPVHYASASDIAARVNELFDVKAAAGGSSGGAGAKGGAAAGGGTSVVGAAASGSGDLRVSKVLPDDRTNSLIIVATERAYLRMLELIKRLDVPQTGEGEIHVLPLQHADAIELVKTLNEIVGNAGGSGAPAQSQAGRRGQSAPAANTAANASESVFEGGIRISADKSTNSIVITSSLRDYASLRAVIDRLDRPRKQVFIDAVIMDLSIKRGQDLGLSFHGGNSFKGDQGDSLLVGGLDPQKSILNPASLASVQGAALGIRGPEIPGSRNLVPGLSLGIPAFGAVLTAIATTGDADVLSTPHILALDNEPAEISVGENIPLQQNALGSLGSAGGAAGAAGALGGLGLGGAGFGVSPQRQDVGTKIKITAHLNESNEARLDIQEEISEAQAAQGQLGVIPITKRTANTKLVVKDQQTVVIGGLMRNRVARSQTKIPLLGDIPVLGMLFRQTKDEMQKTNLILVLTPYIIREQDDLRRVFERKMQERQEFLDRYFVFSDTRYAAPKDYGRANGLVEDIRQAYTLADEKRKLEELTRPRELKGHDPQTPLEMPLGPKGAAGGVTGGSSAASDSKDGEAAPTPRPPINVTPPARAVDRVER